MRKKIVNLFERMYERNTNFAFCSINMGSRRIDVSVGMTTPVLGTLRNLLRLLACFAAA